MTLESFYDIGQTIAVIASLVFVGVQISQNTRALKANSHHAVTDSFNAINTLITSDLAVARRWRLGMAGLENFDEDERTAFGFMALAYMRVFETLHYQHGTGALESKLFEAELSTLKWSFANNPGLRAWWADNPISISAEYRTFIDGLIREGQASGGTSP